MAIIGIVGVKLGEMNGGWLWGGNIEAPQPGLQTDGHELDLTGWVLGRHSPAVAVEVVHEGTVVRRAPIDVRRPDIEKAFPDVPGAENGGFRTTVSVTGMGELELGVRAVLRDQSRVPLGTIRARRRWREGDYEAGAALVSVVIPCHNQVHFLGEAIESVLAQTYPHFEVVVVDDGSTDNTEEVASRYPGVRCVRQENRGLAAARNTGIRRSSGSHLVFLDADDRLLPNALEAGLRCIKAHPECAFVAGRYRYIGFDGSPLPTPQPPHPESEHYLALLRDNFINMHAVVMYQRIILMYAREFDPALDACEDYDLYLRIAREFPIGCHDEVIAEYRKHGANMTRDAQRMLSASIKVLRRQRKYIEGEKRYEAAYKMGMHRWQDDYGVQLVGEVVERAREHQWRSALRGVRTLLKYRPPWQRHDSRPPVGRVRFGSLRRLKPIDHDFGFGRGHPIDRYYIEGFLARHAGDVRGRVLEIADDSYTRQFGGGRVTASDVLHLGEGNPSATIVGDLTCAEHIPSNTFECAIVTQTLHLIYDVRAAVETLYRVLKPGGVVLATFPGISQLEWGERWQWMLTTFSARRLFEEAFPAANVSVEAHGNVLAATAFLHGLVAEELRPEELDYSDPDYELLITVRARKAEASQRSG